MTCIVGLVDGGKVYIAGDSAGVGGYDLRVRADSKVFINGDCLFGFTSSFRMGQLLRYSLQIPKRFPDRDVMAFMCVEFADAVRACLKAGGYAEKTNERESAGVFLVGYAGRLFRMDGDYHIGENISGYDACGCGESFALGAMFASTGGDAKKRLTQALRAAESHSAGVRAPFVVESL